MNRLYFVETLPTLPLRIKRIDFEDPKNTRRLISQFKNYDQIRNALLRIGKDWERKGYRVSFTPYNLTLTVTDHCS